MSVDVALTITGIQELQDANLRAIAALRPSGASGRAIQVATAGAHRYAVTVTHVDTGALRAGHRMAVKGLEGRVFLDPTARNPRSGQPTSEYGPYEHERGGSHAFFQRTVDEEGPKIARQAVDTIRSALP